MMMQELLTGEKKKQNKYHNRKIVRDGLVFDSEKEYQRWCELKLLERAGLISNLQRQVKFELISKQLGERPCYYIADFVYTNEKGKHVVEDTKGVRTKDYVIKRKLMLQVHGIRIVEV